MGRNDYSTPLTVESNINLAVNWCTTNNGSHAYFIFPVLNANSSSEFIGHFNYGIITNLNTWVAANYPGHYFDMREYLVQQADTNLYPADLATLTNDVPAAHLLSAHPPHLNGKGCDIWGQKAAQLIRQYILSQ